MGLIIQSVRIAIDTKKIIKSCKPISAAKIIVGKFIKEYILLELFIAEKCVMFLGGLAASFETSRNLLVVSGAMSTARFIIKNL